MICEQILNIICNTIFNLTCNMVCNVIFHAIPGLPGSLSVPHPSVPHLRQLAAGKVSRAVPVQAVRSSRFRRFPVQAVCGSAGSIHFRFDPVQFSRFRFYSWASCLDPKSYRMEASSKIQGCLHKQHTHDLL